MDLKQKIKEDSLAALRERIDDIKAELNTLQKVHIRLTGKEHIALG